MPDHEAIYRSQAETYDLMISKQPILLEEIERIRPISGLDVLDLGAGSGRLTVPLAAKARSIHSLDASPAMLAITADKLQRSGFTNWQTSVADHRNLPVADQSVDLVVSGWSICYLCSSELPAWQDDLSQVMAEINRVLRPGGTVILFETMGTGTTHPAPPDFLTAYYAKLECEYGFSHKWLRADYSFESLAQAEELARFFFSNELAQQVVQNNWVTMPECAGMWWRTT
ncbi:UNVERIFIED_CONTAM: ubiquinone/menaquinone biosynthesis C-methylase UbiE [Brevibacillus sp. OAP136]